MTTTPKTLSSISYQPSTQGGKRRSAILVVLHADGWIEVYGQPYVDVHMAVMPHTTTPEGERAAEEYLDTILARRYRDLYWPGLRRAADLVRSVSPSDIARRDWELELLTTLDRTGLRRDEDGSEERQIWIV